MEINELKSFVNENLARGLNMKQIAYKLAMDTTDLLDKINGDHEEPKATNDIMKDRDKNYIFGKIDYTGAATDKGEYVVTKTDTTDTCVITKTNTDDKKTEETTDTKSDDGFDPLDD